MSDAQHSLMKGRKILLANIIVPSPLLNWRHKRIAYRLSRYARGSKYPGERKCSISTKCSPFADPDPSKNNYESQEENDSRKRVNRPKKEVVDSKGVAMRGK